MVGQTICEPGQTIIEPKSDLRVWVDKNYTDTPWFAAMLEEGPGKLEMMSQLPDGRDAVLTFDFSDTGIEVGIYLVVD